MDVGGNMDLFDRLITVMLHKVMGFDHDQWILNHERSFRERTIQRKVEEFKKRKASKIHKLESLELKIRQGSFGDIFLVTSSDTKGGFIRKAPQAKDGDLTEEAELTDQIGKNSAVERYRRRIRKGYDANVRFSAPVVYRKGKNFDMEFFIRGDLTENALSIDAYDIFKQLGKQIKELNESGYLHRDLKPANIFMGEDDKVRIGDFGSAIEKSKIDGVNFPGTAKYVNYEEYLKENKNTNKIDMYSVAAIVLTIKHSSSDFLNKMYRYESRGSLETNKDGEALFSRIKNTYKDMCTHHNDEAFGKILKKMIQGEYPDISLALRDFEKLPVVRLKKHIKMALTKIKIPVQDEILTLLEKRNAKIEAMVDDISSIHNIHPLHNVHKIDRKIHKIFKIESQKVVGEKCDLLTKVADSFLNNELETSQIIISKSAVEKQKQKQRKKVLEYV
jgi:serine/threonine protein kinase